MIAIREREVEKKTIKAIKMKCLKRVGMNVNDFIMTIKLNECEPCKKTKRRIVHSVYVHD